MDFKHELKCLLTYCELCAGYITDEDSTEDKYARTAYNDVANEIKKVFEREGKEITDELPAGNCIKPDVTASVRPKCQKPEGYHCVKLYGGCCRDLNCEYWR